MTANEQDDVRKREIVATRVFAAPRALAWQAWSEPQHLKRWWGPNGFTNTFHEFDFRPGGFWRFIMHGPDGRNYENENVFVEILPHERIVFDHLSSPKFRLTARFEDLGGQTRVTYQQLFESADVCEGVKPYAIPGNEQNLDKLGVHLGIMATGEHELVIKRLFDAPPRLVWQAWTDPKHLALWWGPKGFTNPVCAIDLRVGGTLRIVMRAPDGKDYPMRGVFLEIKEPDRLVFTNFPVDANDNPMIDGLTTVTFVERDGKTEMTLHTRAVALVPHAVEMIAGMDAGWTQSLDRLSGHLSNKALPR
jgi:uncharacterized protein YndB with AHSA1/START domain